MNVGIIFALGIIASLMAITVSCIRPEFSKMIGLCGSCMLAISILPSLSKILDLIKSSADKGGINESYITIVLKCAGIACVCAICADTCRDMGQSAIATKLEFASRIAIIITAIPAITALLTLIENTI